VRRAVTPGSVASLLLHLAVVGALLLAPPAPEPAEEAVAPTFAVDFTDGAPAAPSPTPPSPQPMVNLGGPEAEAMPPPQEQPTEALPVPPRPRRYGSALRPRPDRNPFAHVMPFDLSQQSSRSASSASSLGRGLDLSAGPVVRNGALQDSVMHVMGSHGVSDWGERLQEFVEAHKYYPQAAADNGEQGNAVLRVTVARDGTVKSLTLVSSSGSHLLDAAWMAVFRDNRLPAFNDDMAGKQITFNYELDYSLIYRH
jgi:protein TonB